MSVTVTTDDGTCQFPGCDQAVVPNDIFCGDERHNTTDVSGDGAVGAIGPDNGIGTGDGTDRSKARWKTRKRSDRNWATGELRVTNDGDGVVSISGTAIVYGVRTEIMDCFGVFGERIAPGAARHLVRTDVRCLANHQGLPLARTIASTLELRDSDHGLDFLARLDCENSPLANDVVSAIRLGNLSGCSFAFLAEDETWNSDYTERTIKKFSSVPEISVVTFPAYPTTVVQIQRSAQVEAARAHHRAMHTRGQRSRLIATGLDLQHLREAA